MPIIDGQTLADKMLLSLKKRTTILKKKHIIPHLGVIFVGTDPRSALYIRKKAEAAKKIGIQFSLFSFSAKIEEKKLIREIQRLQKKDKLTGLIVQLPLPDHLYTPHILNAIDPLLDVDCLTHENLGRLIMKWGELIPPTPSAIMMAIEAQKTKLPGKNIVIIGAGALVGKPLAIILMNERATVTVCNSATKNLQKLCLAADIIITGVGKKDLVRGNMVKKETTVIDAGVCFEKGKMYGDANVKELLKKNVAVTPTPGGIGPLTVAKLLSNTVQGAEKLRS